MEVGKLQILRLSIQTNSAKDDSLIIVFVLILLNRSLHIKLIKSTLMELD